MKAQLWIHSLLLAWFLLVFNVKGNVSSNQSKIVLALSKYDIKWSHGGRNGYVYFGHVDLRSPQFTFYEREIFIGDLTFSLTIDILRKRIIRGSLGSQRRQICHVKLWYSSRSNMNFVFFIANNIFLVRWGGDRG